MYLLKIGPGEREDRPSFKLGEYLGQQIPPYAILSHRWDAPAEEISFRDLMSENSDISNKAGLWKLEQCCIQALRRGLEHVWIDTCCIDKSSSAELSEAINCMYSWYQGARCCFAYMRDVAANEEGILSGTDESFRRSGWFTRGWTLQELIAPSEVIFFDATFSEPIGTRRSLAAVIESITNVREIILRDPSKLNTASVAEKMSWASSRITTRIEDEAYSMMGLFDVHMPTLYGEGRHAFVRLQEEVMKKSADQSIFAWQQEGDVGDQLSMLASSPSQFKFSSGYKPMEYREFISRFGMESESSTDSSLPPNTREDRRSAIRLQPSYSMTNFGLHIQLPLFPVPSVFGTGYFLAFLASSWGDNQESVLIFLRQNRDRPSGHFHRTSFSEKIIVHRPRPKRSYQAKFKTDLIWVSGHSEPQLPHLVANLQPTQLLVPLRLFIIISPDFSDHVRYEIWPEKSWSREAKCATISPGEHIFVLFHEKRGAFNMKNTIEWDQGGRDRKLAFVFGSHNGKTWLGHNFDISDSGNISRFADQPGGASLTGSGHMSSNYLELDLFSCADFWVSPGRWLMTFDRSGSEVNELVASFRDTRDVLSTSVRGYRLKRFWGPVYIDDGRGDFILTLN